jgi:hypothetical protein
LVKDKRYDSFVDNSGLRIGEFKVAALICMYVYVYFECAKRMFSFRSCQHALYNRSCNTSGGCHHPAEAGGHLGECCGPQNQLSKDSDGLDRIHKQPSSR